MVTVDNEIEKIWQYALPACKYRIKFIKKSIDPLTAYISLKCQFSSNDKPDVSNLLIHLGWSEFRTIGYFKTFSMSKEAIIKDYKTYDYDKYTRDL